jgi:pilus assembly protein CpaC
MTRLMQGVSRAICGALVPAALGGFLRAQTANVPPGPSTAASTDSINMARLSQANAPLTQRLEYEGKPVHVLLGRSIMFETPRRLKRVYVSNPLVIDSFTASPTQIVVTAKTPGISSLILWDEAGQAQTYLVSSDTDVANLQQEIHAAMPNDDIKVEAQQDRISLSGTALNDASSEAAFKLASLYTKTVVNSVVVRQPHIRQVKLKVQIIEVDRSKIDSLGVNIFSQGKNTSAVQTGQFPSVNTTSTTSTTGAATPPTLSISNPLNLLFYNSGLNLGVTIQDLANKQVLQILAEPTITTLSGQKASFLSGGEFPFPVVQGSSGGTTSITIQFRSYGVKLEFTPIVNNDGTIQLKVMPEVSALDFTNAVTISGYTIPAIATRRADTQVELRDGQSFAISGLLDHRTTDILSKMPGIGDVPILGQLFRSKNINHSTVELVVIVTPTIVDPLTDTAVPWEPKLPVPLLDPHKFDKSTTKQKPATTPRSGTGGSQ